MEWEAHYDCLIIYWAHHFGRKPKQVKRQIRRESDFNPRAVSSEGAKGLMQFMPATWEEQANKGTDPFDAEASIMTGCKYMRWLEKSLGSLPLALAAYNCGIGRVRAAMAKSLSGGIPGSLPEETKEYVKYCMDFDMEVLHA